MPRGDRNQWTGVTTEVTDTDQRFGLQLHQIHPKQGLSSLVLVDVCASCALLARQILDEASRTANGRNGGIP